MTYAIRLCDHRSPPGETECWEMLWSKARSCRRCYVDCYRRGWSASLVLADNKERVKRRTRADARKKKRGCEADD